MNDQVQALAARGVSATLLASTLDGDEVRRRMAKIAAGDYRLVYVAPERLVFPGFRGLLRSLPVPLVAVDEAHCISEWGHDFRPEYMEIGGLLAELPGARVLACTATATPVVRDEILARLGLAADTPAARPRLRAPEPAAARDARSDSARERERHVDALLAEARGHARRRARRGHRLRADAQARRGGAGAPLAARAGVRGLPRRAPAPRGGRRRSRRSSTASCR